MQLPKLYLLFERNYDMHTKVLVLDIDGTLTNSDKIITEKTREGILGIEERGHKVILASGRPTPGMKDLSVELEMEREDSIWKMMNSYRG